MTINIYLAKGVQGRVRDGEPIDKGVEIDTSCCFK
jgi:hypothetical protein